MILITGPTGNVGSEVIKQLAQLNIPARALVRNNPGEISQLSQFQNKTINVVTGDLSAPETLPSALAGIETAFLLSPANPNAVELQSNFIRAAKQANVKHIVKLSIIGADQTSPVPLARWHRESELELEASGIAWTFIRPNDLMAYNTQLLIPTSLKNGMFYAPMANAALSMIHESDVAAVVVKALTSPGFEGKTLVITGPEALTYTQVAEKLSRALNRSIQYVDITPDAAREGMLAAGIPEPTVEMVLALRAYEREGHNAIVTQVVNDVLGRPPKSFDIYAAELAQSLSLSINKH